MVMKSCPRQELNLHPTCVGRDFKSLASTSSATRAKMKNSISGDGILSGRRGSNPRPQPWQGCALPTELLPHRNMILKRTLKDVKNKKYITARKIIELF